MLVLCYSISPYVTHILVNRKQVTVGTIGEDYVLFSKPTAPSQIEEAVYSKVTIPMYLNY